MNVLFHRNHTSSPYLGGIKVSPVGATVDAFINSCVSQPLCTPKAYYMSLLFISSAHCQLGTVFRGDGSRFAPFK